VGARTYSALAADSGGAILSRPPIAEIPHRAGRSRGARRSGDCEQGRPSGRPFFVRGLAKTKAPTRGKSGWGFGASTKGGPRRRDRTVIPHPFLTCSRSKTGRMVADFLVSPRQLPEAPVPSTPHAPVSARQHRSRFSPLAGGGLGGRQLYVSDRWSRSTAIRASNGSSVCAAR
jgi:hypothetical protein